MQDSLPPESERRHRLNYFACFTDVVGFSLGILFFSPDTILPAFISNLSPDKIWIGVITAINISGFFLPQLLAACWIEQLPIKRHYVLTLALIERVAIFAIIPFLLYHNNIPPTQLLTIFCLLFAVYSLCMGCNGPAYFDLVSKVVPTRQRGVLYGLGSGVGGVLGLGGIALTGYLIEKLIFPHNYASCFFIGAVILTVTVIPLGLIDEPPSPPTSRKPLMIYLAGALSLFMTDRNFRSYVISQALLSAFPTTIPFLTVYAREIASATELQIVWFTGVLSVGRIVGQPIWGHMADRHGNALALSINIGLGMLAVGLTFVAKSILVFYLIFALVSISRSGLEIPGMNITMEFSTPENLPTYVALRASIIAPFRALLPICVSPLITSIGYQLTFAGLTMMLGLSWWFMKRVRDPRFIPSGD